MDDVGPDGKYTTLTDIANKGEDYYRDYMFWFLYDNPAAEIERMDNADAAYDNDT